VTELLDLIWSHNTFIGRAIIVLILILGGIGVLCAAMHWQRYSSSEARWLENVRGRLRRDQDAVPNETAEEGTPVEPAPAAGAIDLRQLADGIPRETLIGDRLDTILRMKQARVKVNLEALQQSSILKESAKWSLSLPAYVIGLVMMLGLLGTFVGLSLMVADIQQALPDESAHANATQWAASVSSLGRILAGKKTAFSATLVGLFFSIVVSLFNFGLARAQSALYDRLERFTTAELLPATVPAYDDETPWEKLSRQLGDSFESLQSLVTAQARSAEQMAAVETTFGTVINNIEAMTHRAATAPLQSVAGEMTNVVGQLTQVQAAILGVTERLPQIVTAFRQTHQATLQEIQSSMRTQHASIDRLTRAIEATQRVNSRWGFSFAAAGAAIAVLVVLVVRALA
jgi:hypothetical protein